MNLSSIEAHLPAPGQLRAPNGMPELIEALRLRLSLQDMQDFAAIRRMMIAGSDWSGTDSALMRAILRAAADDILGFPRAAAGTSDEAEQISFSAD